VERSFFLNVLFRFPLPTGVVSSGFGMRISPFSHKEHFHNGIDIAAPAGTEVFAAAAGKVSAAGADAVLGNYVVLVHRGNFSTIYGHLLERRINAGQNVGAGDIIGTVGSTGMSTGPHLHFEIRNAGEPWNPSEIFTQ
jgi:murein DD-endopeptidase MepM/ murein hydrolase activator NlpD